MADEINAYPELAHIDVEKRPQLIRSCPSDDRARMTLYLRVIHKKPRPGQTLATSKRIYETKYGGHPKMRSKKDVRIWFRKRGISIIDEHDRIVGGGNAKGMVVNDPYANIEDEAKPCPAIPPEQPIFELVNLQAAQMGDGEGAGDEGMQDG
jgi:hypothetical protein